MLDHIKNNRIEQTLKTIELDTGEKVTYVSAEGTVSDRLCPKCGNWFEVKGLTEAVIFPKYGCKNCRK